MQETKEMRVRYLGQENALEEEIPTHFQYSCLENPMDRGAWQESMRSQRVGHDSE